MSADDGTMLVDGVPAEAVSFGPDGTSKVTPAPGHPFAAILAGTAPAPRTAFPRSGRPEHLRTDDMPSYLRQKGELA